MQDNTTNVRPIASGTIIWESNPGFNPGTAFNPLSYVASIPAIEYTMVAKSDYVALKSEVEQLRTRIAELEEELREDVCVVANNKKEV